MVEPPTLKAAKPDGQIFPTRSLIASVRKDLPVPPTPLVVVRDHHTDTHRLHVAYGVLGGSVMCQIYAFGQHGPPLL